MKGLDTSVVVRLLTGDDRAQQGAAKAYIAKHAGQDGGVFINRVVLIELVWVLESSYAYARENVADVLEGLLRTAEFTIESTTEAWVAVRSYRKGGDFADAIIAATNATVGCDETATFDVRAAKRSPAFVLVTPTTR